MLFIFQINIAYSEVYKWTDENGKTIYGDRPVSSDADKIKIKKRPKQDQHYQKRYKKQQKLLEVMQEERDEKIALKNEELEKKKKQEQQCAKLKKELLEAKNAGFLYEETDDPDNPRIYSDEERKAEQNIYEEYINENC
jgi:uncharacterized protein DUF4124